MSQKTKISLIFLSIITIFISVIPVIQVMFFTGSHWNGVIPDYVDDSSYYYARINDVFRGNIFIGNPYFIEHKDSISPAFFLSDWLAAIPVLMGFDFNFSMVLDIVFWSLFFVFILFFIFRKFGVGDFYSCIFSIITYAQVFGMFVRPVAMQVIFPAYALFLISLFLWTKDCKDRKNSWFLVFTSIYSIYIYTYLMQIVVITFGVLVFYFLLNKEKDRLKELFKLLLFIFILSIPFLIISVNQFFDPLYSQTIFRIGLLSTHLPRMDFWYYGRWIAFCLFGWYLSSRWVFSLRDKENKNIFIFFVITGLALIITAGSNILTGKELELSNHVGRFITWWFPLVFLVYVNKMFSIYKTEFYYIDFWKKTFIAIFILLGFIAMIRNVPRAMPFINQNRSEIYNIQNYGGPIFWLKENVKDSTVVLASDNLSKYIPIMTKHYVLFYQSGALQLVSDKELEDRYMISRFFFGGVTFEKIKDDVKIFGGAGKALLGNNMSDEFNNMLSRYHKEIEPNIKGWLSIYNVQYIIVSKNDLKVLDKVFSLGGKIVYSDEHYIMFNLN